VRFAIAPEQPAETRKQGRLDLGPLLEPAQQKSGRFERRQSLATRLAAEFS